MENVNHSDGKNILITLVCALLMASSVGAHAQSPAEKMLLAKAQSLAARGNLDMAAQTWEQVLLVDGNNKEALLGIARADMRLGKTQEARNYLERLRAAGGDPQAIASVEALSNVQPQSARLNEAAQLAQQGRPADAMRIYREIFGNNPPAGNYALSYYDTEAAIPADRTHAIEGLRKLSKQFPADSSYAVTLGRVLTYDPRTRAEGIAILSQYEAVPAAQAALKQAESWNTKPPASVSTAQQPPPAPVSSPEASAYRALNSGHIDEAKRQFQSILSRQPNNRDALAGMGYVGMKQQDFASALDYFQRARAAGAKGVDGPLNTAQFWLKMAAASNELKAGHSQAAADGYRTALQLKPDDPNALEGLAGALEQAGESAEAADIFERVVRVAPKNASAWRGLFLAQSTAGHEQAALDVNDRIPESVRAQLATDPEYLRMLAQDDLAVGNKAEADRVIAQALALPFPKEGRDLPVQMQLQYAALLMTAKKYEPAIRLYRQIVEQDPENSGAWLALISAQHQINQDDEALATIGRMPVQVSDKEQNDTAFLVLVGSIYQSHHDLDRAQKYLERAASIDQSHPATVMQLADIYAAQGNAQKAYTIYASELDRNPESPQAWRGVLNSLHLLNRDRDALRQIASMPESMRLRLEQDPAYLQTLASIQSSVGQSRAALKTFEQVTQIYARQNMDEPVDVQIQYGWILLKAGDDGKLYALVSNLSNASSITDEQQASLNNLWAAWSIQRANAALAVGDQRRALAILMAAAQAFPQNEDVYGALAGAYMKSGEPRQALAIYSSRNMDHATLPQYQGAIGAALAARDLSLAQQWLEIALDRFKDDPAILKMAAQYEQARGDNQRAAAYYRAALAAMGPAPVGGGVLPQPGDPSYGPSPTQQLMRLLAPSGHAARLYDPDLPDGSPNSSGRTDLSWRDAPAEEAPTLGDYAQGNQSPHDSVSSGLMQPPVTTPADDDATVQPMPVDLPTSQPGSLSRSGSAHGKTRRAVVSARNNSDSLHPASAPMEHEALAVPVAYLKPLPAPVAALPQRQSDPALRTDSYAGIEDPASRLQSAVREISSQPAMIQSDTQDNPAKPPISEPLGSEPLAQEPTAPRPSFQLPSSQTRGFSAFPSSAELPASSALPPLSGPITRSVQPKTDRQQVEEQLAVIEGASSNWVGGSAVADYRSGQPGYDQLAVFSTPIEASGSLGPNVRTTFVVKPVLLDAGQATSLATFRMGTLPAEAVPGEQTASGVGGEFQFRAPSFAAMLGYSPYGFLVQNVIGGLYIHPPSSHFTLTFGRDSIVDTQLSYAGLRDLGSRSATYVGNVWGGVIANSGEAQLAFGNERSGWYIQGGAQYITGKHVETNTRIDGDAGAYWAVWHRPEYGSLTLGVNFFGMHYDHNLRYFTYGQGGYFSPGAFMLAGIPFTFNGHYGPRFHYHVTGSLGVQAFEEDSVPYYPIDPGIQAANNLWYPDQTSVGGNYSFEGEGAYAIAEHWYVGGYLNFNNSRDYASDNVGFFVRYLFRPQPEDTEIGPTGIFPVQGLRPLHVP